MPPCLLLDQDLPLEAVATQPLLFADDRWLIARDLSGATLSEPIRFGLALSANNLYFGYAQPIRDGVFTRRPAGEFYEGLWEEQVLELFLTADSGDAYQEFNLSPSGAWWTQLFTSHRVRDTAATLPRTLEVYAEEGSEGSRSFFRIPRNMLSVKCNFGDSTRANVTAVIVYPTIKRFASVHSGAPGPADFHAAEGFHPFSFQS